MPDNKTIASGLWGLALLGTVVCMAVSAAGMKDETYIVFVFTILFILFGFIFAMLNAQEERAVERRLLKKNDPPKKLQAAFDAMAACDSCDGAPEEERRKMTDECNRRAVEAILAFGELKLSQKEIAMAATAKAIEANKELQRLCERSAEAAILAQAQQQAEELSREAVRELRRLTDQA